jgi:hypothetical protein
MEVMNNSRLPTLAELEAATLRGMREEIAKICLSAGLADNAEVLAEAEMLAMDPDPEPERIVELWSRLRGVQLGPRLSDEKSYIVRGGIDSLPWESPSDNEPNQDIKDEE